MPYFTYFFSPLLANFRFCKHMSAGHRPMIDRRPVADQKPLRSPTDLSNFFSDAPMSEKILRCPDIVRRPEGMRLWYELREYQPAAYAVCRFRRTGTTPNSVSFGPLGSYQVICRLPLIFTALSCDSSRNWLAGLPAKQIEPFTLTVYLS